MDQADPGLIAQILPDIKSTMATIVIGFTIATTLYGVSILQVYLYYRNYSDDIKGCKILVGVLWILDTFTTILVAHALYTYAVINLGNILPDTVIVWSFKLENQIVDIITLLAQGFYAYQIWRGTRNVFLASTVMLLALTVFGIDIWVTVQLFQSSSVADLSNPSILVTDSVGRGLCALCDIIITATLIIYLRSKRPGTVRATERLIDKLILYAVSRGLLTAICQIVFMSLNIGFPDRTYWIPFHLVESKLYVNSVLSTLNVRKSVGKTTVQSDGDLSLKFLSPQSYVTGMDDFTAGKFSNGTGNSNSVDSSPGQRDEDKG